MRCEYCGNYFSSSGGYGCYCSYACKQASDKENVRYEDTKQDNGQTVKITRIK